MPFPDWSDSGPHEADFLRRLIDHVSECLVAVDTEGRIILINQPYCRLLGGSQEDFIGRHVTEVISPKTRLHLVAKGETVVAGLPLEVKGQQLFARQVPVFQDGEIIGAVGLALFSNLGALKKAASLAARQQFSIKDTTSGWTARHTIDDIFGDGARIRAAKEAIQMTAQQSQPVLIQGESGTGKELAANAVHSQSERSGRPFVWVNCASIPEALIDSELFGYEAGAFTGAQARGKPGKFELANGGTLFLDEIGDMPMHLQASLLRAVQNQEIVRVGGTTPIPLDVRIVCATNRHLYEQVRRGAFRLDLYYRLSVMKISMPALRERDDLPVLIEQLMQRIAQQERRPVRKLLKPSLAKLLGYSWPGNTRQLENVLLRFLISGDIDLDDEISDLPSEATVAAEADIVSLQDHLNSSRRSYIRSAVTCCGNDKDKAARALNISRATLYRELRRTD